MRIFFKVLLFPFSLVLTVLVAISGFLIEKCAVILNIISVLIFIGGIMCALIYFFGWPYGETGRKDELYLMIFAVVTSFLLSPYGLPTVLAWIVERLDDLNNAIKSV
jgi:uncharacterized membrane-anchored protein